MPKEQKPKYPIDLGRTMKDMGAMPEGSKNSEKEVFYPSLHLEWEKPYGFPDEGTMTVRFKKTSEENRKNKDGMMQMVNLDIVEILDTEVKKGSENDEEEESTGDVLDKEMKKVQKKNRKKEKSKEAGDFTEPNDEDEPLGY